MQGQDYMEDCLEVPNENVEFFVGLGSCVKMHIVVKEDYAGKQFPTSP